MGLQMRNSKPILLVDDDSAEVMMVRRAFEDLKLTNRLIHSTNGKEALDYLRNEGNKKPCVILLDSNMPKMNGSEFLKVIKADDILKKVPVVALTTSNDERHIAEKFELGVAGYVVKPVDYKKFLEAIRVIYMYWTLSELPDVG
jgi:CheY-like chemotaxis protein